MTLKRLLCFGGGLATLVVILIVSNWNTTHFLKSSCRTSAQTIDAQYKSVTNLTSTGLYEEAKKELVEIIKKNKPDLQPNIPTNLCYLLDNGFDPSLGWLDKEIDNIYVDYTWKYRPGISWELPSIGHLKSWLSLLILALGIYITIYTLGWTFENWRNKKIYLDVKDFNDESIDLKIGKGTTSSLKTLLLEANELGTNYAVNVALEPSEKFDSPIEIKEIATLLKLVNWLSQSPSFTLSGYYQKSQKKGVGLKLVLKTSQGAVFTQDFWQQDYDDLKTAKASPELKDIDLKLAIKPSPEKDYDIDLKISKTSPKYAETKEADEEVKYLHELLAIPASIWLLSKLNPADFEKWLGFDNSQPKSNPADSEKNWKSFAYSRVGVYWYWKGKSDRLEEMLNKSLTYNSNNRFALFTLGVLKMEKAVGEKHKNPTSTDIELFTEAQNWLNRAVTEAGKQVDDSKNPVSPVWYKAMFQLLAIKMYEKTMPTTGNKEELPEEKFLNAVVNQKKHSREFLNEFEILAIIMYASTLLNSEKSTKLDDIQQEISEKSEEIKEISKKYRLVSLDKCGNLSLENKKQPQYDCLEHLQNALKSHKQLGDYQPEEEEEEEERNLINKRKPIFDCLVYYNLACYHALCYQKKLAFGSSEQKNNLSDNINLMFRYLKYAVKHNKTLAEWANIDPSLKFVRGDNNLKLKFQEIPEIKEAKEDLESNKSNGK